VTVANSIAQSGPYQGTGSTRSFPVTFRFLENSHLQVITTYLGENMTLDTTYYTVTGAGSEFGGTIILQDPLPAGYTISVFRDVPLTQLTDYVQSDAFPAQSHEDALDKLTMIAQQQQFDRARTLRVPLGEAVEELPSAAARAGLVLSFDSAGQPIATSFDAVSSGSYLPDGAGAITTTIDAKLREVAGFSAADFGADPSGTVNATEAFIALAAAVQAAGGGHVRFPPGVYTLGQQTFAGAAGKGYAYQASQIFKLRGTARRVTIDARGATFRFANGLKYGAFSPTTGVSTGSDAPNMNSDNRADAGIMFLFEGCTGGVDFVGGDFDGNQAGMALGGVYGDTGRQNFGTAIYVGNGYTSQATYSGLVKLHDVTIKDMPQDGLYLASDRNPMLLENVTIDRCGRNNISWTGGHHLTMVNVVSVNAGQGPISSAPASCLDIEDEVTGYCYNLLAVNCKFSNGAGSAIIALPTAQAQQTFESCVIGGNFQNNNARVRLNNSIVIGTINQPNSAAPDFTKGLTARNTVFATKGEKYGVDFAMPDGSILLAISGFNRSVAFHDCRFDVENGYFGDIDIGSHFHDCYITQSGTVSVPNSTFSGVFHGKNYAYISNGAWNFPFGVQGACLVYGELAVSYELKEGEPSDTQRLLNWGYNGVSPGVDNYAPQAMPKSMFRQLTVNDPDDARISVQTSSFTTGAKLDLNDGYNGVRLRSAPQVFGATTGFSVDIGGSERLHLDPSGNGSGGTDNTQTWGTAAKRWSVMYAGTGTINTSDEREKQAVQEVTAAEKRVAIRCKGLLRSFKFNSAVQAKGADARIHFGVMAQEVKAAFEAEGLIAEHYALFCYDEWNGGDRFGIRYDELFAFIISAL
jgi:hypothetical protein